MLVRFVAVALIGWTLVDLSLYLVIARHKNLPIETLPCVLKTLPSILGVIILVKAQVIAEWLAEKLDL